MYCRYITTPASTAAQILADVVALLTGTTDKNLLSASCDKATTELVTTVAAGWQMHDAAAGVNAVVLKAPVYDNPAQYKYLKLDANTAGRLIFISYDSWNAGTHVGTNANNTSTNSQLQISNSVSTTLFINASVRHAFIQSKYGTTIGMSGIGQAAAFCLEYTRWSPWDTNAAGYLPVICSPNANVGQLTTCRYKNASGVDAGGAMAMGVVNPVGAAISKIFNSIGQQIIPLLSFTPAAGAGGYYGGNVSEQCGIFCTASALGVEGDELVVGGTTYIYMPIGSTNGLAALALPKA